MRGGGRSVVDERATSIWRPVAPGDGSVQTSVPWEAFPVHFDQRVVELEHLCVNEAGSVARAETCVQPVSSNV